MTTEKANIGKIFSSALFGVTEDLIKAKENGQQLPGLLDKIATLAKGAKDTGVDIAKEEAKQEVIKYIPWLGMAILLIVVIIMAAKRG